MLAKTAGVATLFHSAPPRVAQANAIGDAVSQRVKWRRETGVSSMAFSYVVRSFVPRYTDSCVTHAPLAHDKSPGISGYVAPYDDSSVTAR